MRAAVRRRTWRGRAHGSRAAARRAGGALRLCGRRVCGERRLHGVLVCSIARRCELLKGAGAMPTGSGEGEVRTASVARDREAARRARRPTLQPGAVAIARSAGIGSVMRNCTGARAQSPTSGRRRQLRRAALAKGGDCTRGGRDGVFPPATAWARARQLAPRRRGSDAAPSSPRPPAGPRVLR